MKILEGRIAQEVGDLQPPPPYARTDELEARFVASLPDLVAYLAGLFAKHTPTVSKRERAQVALRLRRFLSAVRPYLLALGALSGELDPLQSKYALLEGLLREQFTAGGVRVPANEDAWAFQLKLAKKQARSNRRLAPFPGYAEVRASLLGFSAYVVRSVPPQRLEEALTEWSKSADARKCAQLVAHWPSLARQFRIESPRRLTAKIAFELGNEYKLCSAFFEQRLRLIIYLAYIAGNRPLSWAEVQRMSLKDLLDSAAARAELMPIVAKIDRRVRNALAHGAPELRPDSRELLFHDRDKVVTWSLREFFENTRHLTMAVMGLAEFEALIQFERTLHLVGTLWRGLNPATAATVTCCTP